LFSITEVGRQTQNLTPFRFISYQVKSSKKSPVIRFGCKKCEEPLKSGIDHGYDLIGSPLLCKPADLAVYIFDLGPKTYKFLQHGPKKDKESGLATFEA
jgi:hypothetical protein